MKKLLIGLFTLGSICALAQPCGLEGSIKERIKDCSRNVGANEDDFKLVISTEEGAQIYQDSRTKLLWGEKLSSQLNQYEAIEACISHMDLISDIKWKLPSIRQFKVAGRHGLEKAMPHMHETYWTSSTPRFRKEHVYAYSNHYGQLYSFTRAYATASTRCVGVKR